METEELCPDTVVIQQTDRATRVLCGDDIHPLHHLNHPKRHIRQVSYGGRANIEHVSNIPARCGLVLANDFLLPDPLIRLQDSFHFLPTPSSPHPECLRRRQAEHILRQHPLAPERGLLPAPPPWQDPAGVPQLHQSSTYDDNLRFQKVSHTGQPYTQPPPHLPNGPKSTGVTFFGKSPHRKSVQLPSLEERGHGTILTFPDEIACYPFKSSPRSVRFQASLGTAATLFTSRLHHHVPHLSRRPAGSPVNLTIKNQPTTNPGPESNHEHVLLSLIHISEPTRPY